MKKIVAVIALVLASGCAANPPAKDPVKENSAPKASTAGESSAYATLRGEEAKTLVKNGAKLVDVRTPAEYAAGHIDGAINIPVDEMGTRHAETGALDAPVVLYCGGGKRAAKAAATLKEHGHTRVENLGGITDWPSTP